MSETKLSSRVAKARRPTRHLTGLDVSYVLGIGMLAATLLILTGWNSVKGLGEDVAQKPRSASPPTPEPLVFKPSPPEEAMAINALNPVSELPNRAAIPYVNASKDNANYERSLGCLTAAIYYEAAIEPLSGARAVAQVVLNRVRHPAYPKSVCGVVFQGSERRTGCQFTFTCDGSLARSPGQTGWQRAQRIARDALAGSVYKPVGWATHYHTNWVVPYWSSSLTKLANVGSHIFYRWTGPWGTAGAFRSRVSGAEPLISQIQPRPAAVADDAEAIVQAEPAPRVETSEGNVDAQLNAVIPRTSINTPIELSPSAQDAGIGAASMSAAARVRAPVGVRVEPDSKRAGCRQASVAAIGASSVGPPPC